MITEGSITDSIPRLRKARDLSQEELAEAAAVSVDTVARIEQGRRKATRPATMRGLASALDVDVSTLLSQPQASTHRYDPDVTSLRRAVSASDHIPGLTDFAEPVEVVQLNDITADVHQAWRAYVEGRHRELLESLPTLLLDARRLIRSTTGGQEAQTYRVLSTAYRLAAGLASRIGFQDLAASSAERALDAARFSDEPELETAVSLRYLAWTFVRQSRFDDGERVAITAAEQVQPAMLDRDLAHIGVFGNLLFNAATAALSKGQADRAADLLTEAQTAAARTRTNTATEAAIFGPRVVALQRIDHAVHVGEPERALRLSEKLPLAQGTVPSFWEAGHRLTLAAAATQLRMDRRALGYLAEARDLAPDWAHQQPLGQTTMDKLIDRAPRRRGSEFSRLAAHYGTVV